MSNFSLDIKYVFLSFAQNYYADANVATKYNWTKDPRTTDIVIADKYAIDIGTAAKRPSIILSRGPFGWTNTFRNEGYQKDEFFIERGVPFGSANSEWNKKFTDILQGSITYNVISKNGVQCEDIASELYTAVTGYRDILKKKGIHKITGLRISDERLLRQSSEIELSAVSIDLSFLSQRSVILSDKQNNIRIWIDEEEQFEGIDYRIEPDGSTITFKCAPETGAVITVNYIDAITLQQINDVNPVEAPDGNRISFTLPGGGVIYGFYTIVDTINISKEVNFEYAEGGDMDFTDGDDFNSTDEELWTTVD